MKYKFIMLNIKRMKDMVADRTNIFYTVYDKIEIA